MCDIFNALYAVMFSNLINGLIDTCSMLFKFKNMLIYKFSYNFI